VDAGELLRRAGLEPGLADLLGGRTGELEPFRAATRVRAGEGVALDAVLREYRMAAIEGFDAIAAAATTAADRAALPDLARELMATVDRLSSAVADAYLDEQQYRLAEDTRLVAELIDALAGGEAIPVRLREFATRAGLRILESYRPFALARPGAATYVHSQLAASLRLQGLAAVPEGGLVVGLAGPDAEADTLGAGAALVALGEPARRPELREALDDVRLQLALALRDGQARGVVDGMRFAIPMLMARSPRVAGQLRRRVLGPLENYEQGRSGELLRTLRAYFAARLNRGKAAKALGVHPNTLDYRLGRIEELCEVRLSDPGDIARMELALAQLDVEAL
jgi:hypothetical protein